MVRNTRDTLGGVIKSARLEMKLTQEKFAEMVDLSPRYIMSIENENKKPSYQNLFKIIRALGVDANAIFYPERQSGGASAERLSRLLSLCAERDVKAVSALVEVMLNDNS